jgi:hypothetical protein
MEKADIARGFISKGQHGTEEVYQFREEINKKGKQSKAKKERQHIG